MRAALLLLALVGASLAREFSTEWLSFKMEHGKEYLDNAEDEMRYNLWRKATDYVESFNAKNSSMTLGMNQFGDLTDEEYQQYLGYKANMQAKTQGNMFESGMDPKDLPTTVDWRQKGFVTPVKNQGFCGSCWAFSTTGSTEGQHFKKTGKLVSLSEQNLIDCSDAEGNQGCQGGWMDYGFKYILKNGGIDTEESYPYTAMGGVCSYDAANSGATVTGHKDVRHKSEFDLHKAVATVGPISVAIDASSTLFRFYRSGVFHDVTCSQIHLDHGVLVVGYGTYIGQEYWLVKNSWGTGWGSDGYIMMSRNRDNNCGIATKASYPTV